MMARAIWFLALGLGAFALTFALARAWPSAFPHAWLTALSTWLSAPLGCMGLLLTHSLTGGKWGYAVRPQLALGARALLLLPLFLIPLALVSSALYPWLRVDGQALANAFYLNETAALARGLGYLVIWFSLDWLIERRLRRSNPDAGLAAIAPAGLILLALTATFMSIDLLMSLDPKFSSSVFGLLRIADMGLLALSFAIALALSDASLTGEALRQLGRLLLAVLILWAYLAFMELLIVWQSNLPNEATWYAPRLSGGWGALLVIVAALRFFIPFFVLLSPRAQSSRAGMGFISLLVIAGACAENLWIVAPASDANSVMIAAIFVAALIGMFATTLGLAWVRSFFLAPHRVANDRSSS